MVSGLAVLLAVILVCLGRLIEVHVNQGGLSMAMRSHLKRCGGGDELVRQLRLMRSVDNLWIVRLRREEARTGLTWSYA